MLLSTLQLYLFYHLVGAYPSEVITKCLSFCTQLTSLKLHNAFHVDLCYGNVGSSTFKITQHYVYVQLVPSTHFSMNTQYVTYS